MNFKLPNNNFNEHQLELLESIQLAQENILAKCTELNNRITELEKAQREFSLAVQKNCDEKTEESFSDKLNFNIFLTFVATLIMCAALVIFGWHFWEIPSQTQAVNDYIYSKIVKESPTQNFP